MVILKDILMVECQSMLFWLWARASLLGKAKIRWKVTLTTFLQFSLNGILLTRFISMYLQCCLMSWVSLHKMPNCLLHRTRNRVIECYFMKFHLVCSCLWKQLPAFYYSISCLALHFLVVANFSRILCVCPSSKYMELVLNIWDHPYTLLWFHNPHNK
jgi:hypothetical protein